MSYTTFKYSNLQIERLSYSEDFPEDAVWESGETPSTNATGASRAIWLHRPAYRITFNVRNDGEVAGTEVGFIPHGSLNKSPDLFISDATVVPEIPSILWRASTDAERVHERVTESGEEATSRDQYLEVRPFLLGRRRSGVEETGWEDRCPYFTEQQAD